MRNFYLQEAPELSRCLGIFGLSIYTTEQQINHIFSKYGPVERVQVVIDAKVCINLSFQRQRIQFWIHCTCNILHLMLLAHLNYIMHIGIARGARFYE